MSSQAVINAPEKNAATPVPVSALDNLAARIRPNGLFLAMLSTDGTVTYHDSAAGVFFLRCPPVSDQKLLRRKGTPCATTLRRELSR